MTVAVFPTGASELTAKRSIRPNEGGAGALLRNATLWLDARNSVAGEQVAVNRGTGGSALNATYGSTAGVDTNDPLFLPHTGENYFRGAPVVGLRGGGFSVADEAPLNITGDVEMVARVAANWTGATSLQPIVAKGYGPSYSALVSTDARIGTFFSVAAVGQFPYVTVSDIPPNGTWRWLKVTRATATGTVNVYSAPDQIAEPTSWSLIGTGSTTAGALDTNTHPLAVACTSQSTAPGAQFDDGKDISVKRVIVRNGIGGPVVFNFNAPADLVDSSAPTFTTTSGHTAFITRPLIGRKQVVVTRPIWLFGTDDYLEIPDNALLDFAAGDSFTVLAVIRRWGAPTTNETILNKNLTPGAVTAGYNLWWWGFGDNRIHFTIGDGTNGPDATAPAITDGALATAVGVRNVGTDNLTMFAGNVAGTPGADTTTATSANAGNLQIGIGSAYIDAELVAVAVFRRVLTAAEIAAINAYYGTA